MRDSLLKITDDINLYLDETNPEKPIIFNHLYSNKLSMLVIKLEKHTAKMIFCDALLAAITNRVDSSFSLEDIYPYNYKIQGIDTNDGSNLLSQIKRTKTKKFRYRFPKKEYSKNSKVLFKYNFMISATNENKIIINISLFYGLLNEVTDNFKYHLVPNNFNVFFEIETAKVFEIINFINGNKSTKSP